jgi:hypothetical protein
MDDVGANSAQYYSKVAITIRYIYKSVLATFLLDFSQIFEKTNKHKFFYKRTKS